MGQINKKQYEYRRESAARRMTENAKNDSLTEEQHDALARVCRIRHDIHSCNRKDFFCSGGSNYKKFNNYLDGGIREILQDAGITNMLSWDITGIPDDLGYDKEEFTTYEEYVEDSMEQIDRIIEKVNCEIENFLKKIDGKYNTSYAPTGLLRSY